MGIAIHARRLIRRSKSEEKRIFSTYKLSPTEGVVGIYLTNKIIGVNAAYLTPPSIELPESKRAFAKPISGVGIRYIL